MTRMTCRRVHTIFAENRRNDIKGIERSLFLRHLNDCAECRDFVNTADALDDLALDLFPAPLPPLMERRLVLSAMENRLPSRSPRIKPRMVFVASLLAAAAAAATLVVYFGNSGDPQDKDALESAEHVAANASGPTAASVDHDAHPVDADVEVVRQSHHFVKDGELLELVGSRIWGTAETSVFIETMPNVCRRIRLVTGKIVASVDPVKHGCRFLVETPNAHVEVKGTFFSVEVLPGGAERVRVAEGTVAVRDFSNNGREQFVGIGQQFLIGDTQIIDALPSDIDADTALTGVQIKKRPVSDAFQGKPRAEAKGAESSRRDSERELLTEAKALRKARDFDAAQRAYLKLISGYPDSGAAANALIALGQMELGVLNDSDAAVHHFSTYLDKYPGGVLVDEAWLGRVRALTKQKKFNAAVAAATSYLAQNPQGSIVSEIIRRRGDAHAKRHDCQSAKHDYQTVMSRWPNTREARIAEAGLSRCDESH